MYCMNQNGQEIFLKNTGVQTRWANAENPDGAKGEAAKSCHGRKGTPCLRYFKPGETRVLAHAQGSGVIRHIWITTEKREVAETLKGYRLECFWDGSDKPAVSVPMGDFFCFNSGVLSPMENEFFSNPEGRSFNCYIPMPFHKEMKITMTNETNRIEEIQFFYQVDYTLGDDVTNALYFHAFYNRNNNTHMKEDYTILPTLHGCGRYLGASFGVIANPLLAHSWWGEGEVKCFIDGDAEYPTLAGTGTEDYIGTAWGQGRYANRYQGCVFADADAMRFSFYRFHCPDPVYFAKDIRITIQQIGYAEQKDIEEILENGLNMETNDGKTVDVHFTTAIFERFGDDWSSVAYFYLDQPSSSLPELPPYEERIEKYQSHSSAI